VEYDQVALTLKNASLEIEGLKHQNQQRENSKVNFENDINRKIAHYEQSIFTMTRNHEDLQRKMT
jgi:hypothetical protein